MTGPMASFGRASAERLPSCSQRAMTAVKEGDATTEGIVVGKLRQRARTERRGRRQRPDRTDAELVPGHSGKKAGEAETSHSASMRGF